MLSNTNQFKHTLIYGGIAGGIIFVLLILGFIFGSATNSNLEFFAALLFISGMVVSTKRFRDLQPDKVLTFGKAFGTSLLTAVITGFIWAVYGYILYKASPGLLEEKMHEAQEMYLNLGWDEEKIVKSIEQATPFSMAFGYMTNAALYGSLLSLIIAAVMFRRPNPLVNNNDSN